MFFETSGFEANAESKWGFEPGSLLEFQILIQRIKEELLF